MPAHGLANFVRDFAYSFFVFLILLYLSGDRKAEPLAESEAAAAAATSAQILLIKISNYFRLSQTSTTAGRR